MPPAPPPPYPYHRDLSSRFNADGYGRDRGVRHNHRSRSRSPIPHFLKEFELGDSYRAERSLVRYQFPPRTTPPKDSVPAPYIQKDHYGVSDKRESGLHGVNDDDGRSRQAPTSRPSTHNPRMEHNGDEPFSSRYVPPYGSSYNNPHGPLPQRHESPYGRSPQQHGEYPLPSRHDSPHGPSPQHHGKYSLPHQHPSPYGPSINTSFKPQHERDCYSPSRPPEPKGENVVFDAVHDPSQSSKDLCVQFDLPIEQDLSPYLADFCRFRRLGRFKEARDLYQSKLAKHSTMPYILIHYAEMLVVSGDYKSFRELVYPSRDEQNQPKNGTDGKLRTNFELLKLVTCSPVWNYTIAAMETVRGVLEDLADEQVLGSTEVSRLELASSLKSSKTHQIFRFNCSHSVFKY